MVYITASDLKTYLGTTSTVDDSLLSDLIDAAQSMIEGPPPGTGRKWEANSDTRYFDWQSSHTLELDEDLLSVATLTNGDDETLTEDTDFLLYPLSGPPYRWIEIKEDSGSLFDYEDTPQKAISIQGSWGHTTSPPERIVQATRRLAAYYYRQKDTGAYDDVGMVDVGVVVVPKGIPADVAKLLHADRKKFMLG